MSTILIIGLGLVIYYYYVNQENEAKDEENSTKVISTGDVYKVNIKEKEHVLRSLGFVDKTETIEVLENKWFGITRLILPLGLITSFFFPYLIGPLIIYMFVKFIFIKCRILYLKRFK
jgi:hypothetical protein